MAKPEILIDLGKLKDVYSGLGQVSLQFGRALLQENNNEFNFTFLIPKGAEKYFEGNVNFEYLSFTRRYLPFLCKKYELWHSIHGDSAYMPSSKNASYLLTIHDLNFMYEKSRSKAQKRLNKLQKKINKSTAITFISKFTKTEAQKYLQLPDVKQQVIYNGIENLINKAQQKPGFLSGNDEFLFAIGVITAKKNFEVLVDLMALLPAYKLIIAGNNSTDYAKKLRQKINALNLQNRILLPGKISAAEKTYLYANCKAFLFPSLYEGFGLPVIEAMQFGKPVFLSKSSSLPEIGKNNAYYWENFNAADMKQVFDEGMRHFSEHAYMAEDEKNYAQKFSWQKNAATYLSLYRSLLG